MTKRIVDAHHHLWEYNSRDYGWMTESLAGLRRNFLVPELEAVASEAGVDGTVVVQARQTIEETVWLLDLATHHPLILGVVGWVPLIEPGVGDVLEQLSQNRSLRAVRHVLQDELDDLFMLREDFNRGIHLLRGVGLAYDILIYERHLPQTIAFVDRHPDQVFVLDHIAKPRIKERILSPWDENIRELAKRENVFCKVSGMATEADWNSWTIDTVRPYFDGVLHAFGPGRLMFGSDWPVLTLAGSYSLWMKTIHTLIADLAPDEQASICRESAVRAYGLADPTKVSNM